VCVFVWMCECGVCVFVCVCVCVCVCVGGWVWVCVCVCLCVCVGGWVGVKVSKHCSFDRFLHEDFSLNRRGRLSFDSVLAYCTSSSNKTTNWASSVCFLLSLARRNNQTVNVRITKHWGAFVQTLLQWKSNNYYIPRVCVCSLRYPACNAHAPSCHLLSARLYSIPPHYLIKDMIVQTKVIEHKMCFNFLYKFFLRYPSFQEEFSKIVP